MLRCISNVFFINNPDPNPDPELRSRKDPDPKKTKKIIKKSDPQH
jgi:hypothetical protein